MGLVKHGFNVEVLNFGVPAFGMDQAYQRWERDGIAFAPHIVIFGLHAENAMRNENLIRALWRPNTGFPFTKPRYIFVGENLKLINLSMVANHIHRHIISPLTNQRLS